MKIFVHAKPGSKKVYVRQTDATHFTVAVREPPVDGKANKAIVTALADYLDLPSSEVFIVSGETARKKIFVVPLMETELEKKITQKKLFDA